MDVKKVLLVLGASVIVLSGVAMVSAYEAHIVNVHAHVENALDLSQNEELEFGTVFPEEWLVRLIPVRMSTSFCATDQQRMTGLSFRFYLEEKSGYGWLGDAIYLQWGATSRPTSASAMTNNWKTSSPPIDPPIDTGLTGTLVKVTAPDGSTSGTGGNLWVGVDVPVFRGYYNEHTDVETKPSGLDGPTVIIETDDPRYPTNMEDGVDLAVAIKIQVEDIFKPAP